MAEIQISVLIFKHALVSMTGPIWKWHSCKLHGAILGHAKGETLPIIELDVNRLKIKLEENGPERDLFLIAPSQQIIQIRGTQELAACGVRFLNALMKVGDTVYKCKEVMLDYSSMTLHINDSRQSHSLPFLLGVLTEPLVEAGVISPVASETEAPPEVPLSCLEQTRKAA